MFRRRTDFSWPLIIVLVGLFFLSLKLPRQWERIARPAPLVLKPHNSLAAKGLPSVASSHGEISPLESFRSVKPAGHVASNNEASFRRFGKRRDATGHGRTCRGGEIAGVGSRSGSGARSKNRLRSRLLPRNRRDSLTNKLVYPEPSTSSQPVLPLPQVEARSVASSAAEKTGRSAGLARCSSLGAWSQPCQADRTVRSEIEVRRLPPLESAVVQAQPSEKPNEGSDVVRQPLPSTVVPEPAGAVRAVARDCRNGLQSGSSRRARAATVG